MSTLSTYSHAARSTTARRSLLWLVAAFASTALVARWEQSVDPNSAVDRSLSFVHCVVVPLLAFAFVRSASEGGNLREIAQPLVRYGADRRTAAARALSISGARLLATSLLLTWLTLGITHGARGALLSADLLATTPITCFAALTYVAVFAAAATWGRTGSGSLWVLLYDWVLGSLPLPIAWLTPRGHVRHLLGFEVASGLPQWASFPALALFLLVAVFVLAWRVPR